MLCMPTLATIVLVFGSLKPVWLLVVKDTDLEYPGKILNDRMSQTNKLQLFIDPCKPACQNIVVSKFFHMMPFFTS